MKMKIALFLMILSISLIFAQNMSSAKVTKLSKKGEKIANTLCDSSKLPSAEGTIGDLMEKIKSSHACPSLSKSRLEALAYYISNGSMKLSGREISVPAGAKCPVCGMFVSKYPKWAAFMEVDGKKLYFDGVKDMMKFYIFDGDFPYDRSKISSMQVTDFYTLESIPAKEAFYVVGSNLFGPMGNELIPFKTQKDAENFMKDHGGREIIPFDKITDKMVMELDGVEQEQ